MSYTIDWFPEETAPIGEHVIVYLPKRKDRQIYTGRLNITANKHCMWIIEGQFGFDIGIPEKWAYFPNPPI